MAKIEILGAREHNLQNVDIDIPRNALVVFTGLSGSGKSSLAFDTIYAEGQRRYMETFSAYARHFIGNIERPDRNIRLHPPALRPRGHCLFPRQRRADGEIHRGADYQSDN